MGFKDEMLQNAGIQFSQESIRRLFTEGAYFDKYLTEDLKHAVRSGALSIKESNNIKRSVNSKNKIDKFFEEYVPMMNTLIESRLSFLEGNIESSLIQEDTEMMTEEMKDLAKKSEILRSLMC